MLEFPLQFDPFLLVPTPCLPRPQADPTHGKRPNRHIKFLIPTKQTGYATQGENTAVDKSEKD